MQRKWIVALFAGLLLMPPCIVAEDALPSGTILPVRLDTGMNAAKVRAGDQIRTTVMQDVPGTAIRRGARVEGHVVKTAIAANGGRELEIEFDALQMNGRMVPMKADLRALASFVAVEEAQVPEEGGSRGMTPANWTTEQIGGEQFYRGSYVASGMTNVGKTTPWGALDVPRTQAGMPCRGVIGRNNGPQAMWLFSSDACGVYGFSDVRIEHAGRGNPFGIIILRSRSGKLNVARGAGLLIRASSPATTRPSANQENSTAK